MIFSGRIWFSTIAVLSASSLAVTTISRTGAPVALAVSVAMARSLGSGGRDGREIGDGETHAGRDADAVVRIGLVEVDDLPLDDLQRHALHGGLDVVEQLLLLVRLHEAEQVARLPVVVVAGA